MWDMNGGPKSQSTVGLGEPGAIFINHVGNALVGEEMCLCPPNVYISYMIQCRKSVIVRNQIAQVTVTMLIQESAKQRKDNTMLVPASCNLTLLQLALFPVFCFTEAQAMSLRFG